MNPPLLILSGTYVNAEIAAEYGRIPPSFLPLGGKRLFVRQIALARGPIFLTLPSDFQIDAIDAEVLGAWSVKIIRLPPELGLIEALRMALLELADYPSFDLLHGDTLVEIGDMADSDSLACHDEPGPYFWAYIDESSGVPHFEQGFGDGKKSRRVVCGYQRVGARATFANAANEANTYTELLNIYSKSNPSSFHFVSDWYDFGHLGLLYRSKRKISVARAFNNITSDAHFAVKSSDDMNKMRAEAHWYENIPAEMRIYTPRYFGKHDRNQEAGYRIEYIYQPLVSDLFVFGDLPVNAKIRILTSCFDFLAQCRAVRPEKEAPELSERYLEQVNRALYHEKTRKRIEQFASGSNLSLREPVVVNGKKFPPLLETAMTLSAAVPKPIAMDISVCHGDFFYGNMFFDYRASRIVAIDPRGGFVPGSPSIWGDRRYDIAKLAHSAVGGYDHILLGRSKLSINGNNDWTLNLPIAAVSDEISEFFIDEATSSYGISEDTLFALTALLFFSMLPLHADDPDRQHKLLTNGFRLAAKAKLGW